MVAIKKNDRCVLEVGNDIRKFRARTGLSQKDIGKAMGYSPSSICNIEKRISNPTVKFYLAWKFVEALMEAEIKEHGTVEVQ